jgi:hypothetical protein
MSSPQNGIEALTNQVALLTARVYALEQEIRTPSEALFDPAMGEHSQTPPVIPGAARSIKCAVLE